MVMDHTIRVVESVEQLRAYCTSARAEGREIGLVPTMGALHAGHASLMKTAVADGRLPVVSIFVNPTQFGPSEDLDRYPRTLREDIELCKECSAGCIFAPSVREMYPVGECTRVTLTRVTEGLCGESRPGHFTGVATIVTKLFAATGPCFAYFGRKDYQQYRVIERMARDLMLPVRVIGCPTVREADGLALSSRNRYLSKDERPRALGIARGLASADQAFHSGERDPRRLLWVVRQELERAALREDYVALREPMELEPLESVDALPERVLLAIAAYCGGTRLIDNLVLGEELAPTVARGV